MLLLRILLVIVAYLGSITTVVLLYVGLASGYRGYVFGFWVPPRDGASGSTLFAMFAACFATSAIVCALALLIGPGRLRRSVAVPTIYLVLVAAWWVYNMLG